MGEIQKKTQQIEKNFLRAATKPKSYDESRNTIEVVAAAGTRGLRMGWYGDYYEELAVDEKSVRMGRFNNGAPALLDHRARLDAQIGVIERASIVDGEIVCTIRLTKSEKFADEVARIKEGIIRKMSVGYMVYRYEEVAVPDGETPIFRATDWEPCEVSFVSVPFDDQAQARTRAGEEVEKSTCEILTRGGEDMSKPQEGKGKEQPAVPVTEAATETPVAVEGTEIAAGKEGAAPAVEAPAATETPAEPSKEQAAALDLEKKKLERERACEIIKLASRAKLSEKEIQELVASDLTVAQAGEKILARWVEGGSNVTIDNRTEVGADKKLEVMSRGIKEALLHRFDPTANKLTDEAKEFRGMSLLEMAKDMLAVAGVNTRGMSKMDIASRALNPGFWQRVGFHGTTDFPNLLADVANKTLRQSYEQAPQTWRPITRIVTVPDFKTINRVQLGEAPSLELVGEHGEFTYGTMGDAKESYVVKSYGRIFAITRQAIINDDLDAFTRAPQLLGRSAANLESDLLWGVVTANAAMADGTNLFHADHANLAGTPAAISVAALGKMREAGRKQTGLDGETLLNIMFKYLAVPAALETVAQQYISQLVPALSSSVNPFVGAYNLIVEPRLDAASATAWYGFAEPSQIDVLEAAYLQGGEGVRIESEIDFDTDGMKLKAAHDIGVKAIDHRGMYKNAGA